MLEPEDCWQHLVQCSTSYLRPTPILTGSNISSAIAAKSHNKGSIVLFNNHSRRLFLCAKTLFPDTDIEENYLHPDLMWGKSPEHAAKSHTEETQKKIELDIWIPQHKIAIEYQGEQHYHNTFTRAFSGDLYSYRSRDYKKKQKCESVGIQLFYVPYWWDSDVTSLSSILELN